MKKTTKSILTMLGMLMATLCLAQPEKNIGKEKIKELSFMLGEWSGGGWMINPDRTRSEFTQEEKIEMDLNGAILIIHGNGWDMEGKSIHNALGIISYDIKEDKYFMQAMLENGQQTKAELELISENKIEWWFEVNNGSIKYQLTFEGDAWTEKGEFSLDGSVWYPFIEFTLTKNL
ncbi:MAG: hypothetical protein GY816_05125 [Cytophagales bacterium]|nr:hypothetical protein [Cytophagales bacterium]